MPGKTATQTDPPEGARQTPFSLFEGDRLNRVYARIGMGRFHRFSLLKRCLAAVAVTYVPLALIAWPEGLTSTTDLKLNFFADFAAYVQLIVALPLFLACEPIMDNRTREVTDQLVYCNIVKPEDQPRLFAMNAQIERLRKAAWPDLVCLFFAFALSLVILVPEFAPKATPTWHVGKNVLWPLGHFHTLTYTGAWAFLISLPILNYTWLRFVWKVLLWSYYLFRITRMRLDLHPTHPDLTGGIGFISDAQGQFALFLLAYGLSNIAAPVGYQIVILDYQVNTMTVWGPMLSFAIGGPLVFTLPLFMFTRQLFHAKHHALAIYRERVTEASRRIESYWEPGRREPRGKAPVVADEMRELAELSTLSTMFTHIEKMRVVPFDWRSFGQLMASSFGSLATLVPLLQADDKIGNMFELLSKVFRMLGGGGG